MSKQSNVVRTGRLVMVMLAAAALVMPLQAAERRTDLSHLASEGSFDELLTQLRSGLFDDASPAVTDLAGHIERYQTSREQQRAERVEAYAETLETIAQELGKDNLDKALFSAAEAQSLSLDKESFLAEPTIRDLVERAVAAGAEAERQSEWLEALSIYRSLEALHNQDGTYHDDLRRVVNHVRVLRVYAPPILQDLYNARVEKLRALNEEAAEEDIVEPPQLDNDDDWRTRLANVEMPMLRQTFVHANRYHIDNQGYRPLLLGAVQSLRIMVNTPGLGDAFPTLKEPERLRAFDTALASIESELRNRAGDIRYLEVDQYLTRIDRINDQTARLPRNVLAYELAEGAVGTLDDYSAVVWPLDLAEMFRTLHGNFTGVGILISSRGGKLKVASPLSGGPALRGGIRFDDVIVTVDGESTKGWTLKRAVDRITGEEGTQVVLGVERKGVDEPIYFNLTRERIKIDSVRGWERSGENDWDWFIDREHRIGYVRLTQFMPQTADDLDAAVAEMQKDGPINGLILDVRFNPGGLLRAAVAVVDRFINSGLIVSTVNVHGETKEESSASPRRTYPRFPVVVLINQGSASASEIVAGALQDYGRAHIIGTRSYGKGSVQDMYPLQGDKALLKLTTQYYRLPKNRIIHRRPGDTTWGVEPDLIVDVTDQHVAKAVRFRQELDVVHADDEVLEGDKAPKRAVQLLEDAIDPQLDAALLWLKSQLVVRDIGMAKRPQATHPAR